MDLIDAVKANDFERVRLLVEQGADKNKGDGYGRTPLYWAARDGHLNVAQYLVEQFAELDKADNNGFTPLCRATVSRHFDVCRYLLEQGADRDKADSGGYTPLHWAAHLGLREIASLLMRHGADLNARNYANELPIEMGHQNTQEIKQAIRDEPRRRMDEALGKRATEQDRHPNAATSASTQQEVREVEKGINNKQQHLVEGAAVAHEGVTKIAKEEEDSEPSSDEKEGY